MTMPTKGYLTDRAHLVFALAHDIADRRGDEGLTLAHVFLGLLEEREGVVAAVLHIRGLPVDALARELEAELPPPGAPRTPAASRSWTPEGEQIFEECVLEARELGTVYYGTEHLLLALLRNPAGTPSRVLARYWGRVRRYSGRGAPGPRIIRRIPGAARALTLRSLFAAALARL